MDQLTDFALFAVRALVAPARLVKSARQHGRDLLRSSKHHLWLDAIFASTRRSGALEEKQMPMLGA